MGLFDFFKKESSAKNAKDRLQVVILQDRRNRLNYSTQVLEMLKADILRVIRNYMEIDENELEFEIAPPKHGEDGAEAPVLFANIPIKNLRRADK